MVERGKVQGINDLIIILLVAAAFVDAQGNCFTGRPYRFGIRNWKVSFNNAGLLVTELVRFCDVCQCIGIMA